VSSNQTTTLKLKINTNIDNDNSKTTQMKKHKKNQILITKLKTTIKRVIETYKIISDRFRLWNDPIVIICWLGGVKRNRRCKRC